jgi:serine/threonine protein kinase
LFVGFLVLRIFIVLDELGDVLGRGSFSTVRRAVHKFSKQNFAIKIVNIESLNLKEIANVEQTNLEKLKGCSPYLINLVDCFEEVFLSFYLHI